VPAIKTVTLLITTHVTFVITTNVTFVITTNVTLVITYHVTLGGKVKIFHIAVTSVFKLNMPLAPVQLQLILCKECD